jgi:hypothetical protein
VPEGRCGLLLMMPKSWRDELHRQARQVRRPTAKFVLSLVAQAAGLAAGDGAAVAPRRMTVTEKLALQDYPGAGDSPFVAATRRKYPGKWRAARRRAGADGAAGAALTGEDGATDGHLRKEPPSGAGRPGAGPNSGDAP